MATRYRTGQSVRIKDDRGTGVHAGDIAVIERLPDRGTHQSRFYNVRMLNGVKAGSTYSFTAQEFEPFASTGMADPGGLNTSKVYAPTPEHLADIKAISDRMRDVADEQDWCIEGYNDVVAELNQTLTVKLPLKETEFTIVIQDEEYDGSGLSYNGNEAQESVTISATSTDDAVEKVAEIVNKYLRGDLVEKS